MRARPFADILRRGLVPALPLPSREFSQDLQRLWTTRGVVGLLTRISGQQAKQQPKRKPKRKKTSYTTSLAWMDTYNRAQ
jgi:hypothetical protein